MNKALVYWIVQIVMIVIMAATAGVAALIGMGAVGGTALGLAPEAHFKLAGGIICPEGGVVEFDEGGQTVTYSGGTPTYGRSVTVSCTDAEGVKHDLTAEEGVARLLTATAAILSAYLVGGFVVMFVPGVIIGAILVHVIFNLIAKRSTVTPAVRSF